MKHSALNRRKLVGEVADRHEAGLPSPTDAEIMQLCDLWQIDQVRSLLAQLGESGEITISWADGQRVLSPGREARPPIATPTILAPTVKTAQVRAATPERRALIAQTAAKLASRNAAQEFPRGASGTARKAPCAASSGAASRIDDHAPPEPPQPGAIRPPAQAAERMAKRDAEPVQPVKARQPLPPPTKTGGQGRKQVNIALPFDVYASLSARAASAGVIASKMATALVTDALNGLAPPPVPSTDEDVARALRSLVRVDRDARDVLDFAIATLAPDLERRGKPRISAGVYRAWAADGRELHQFLTDMIALGVEAARHEKVVAA